MSESVLLKSLLKLLDVQSNLDGDTRRRIDGGSGVGMVGMCGWASKNFEA